MFYNILYISTDSEKALFLNLNSWFKMCQTKFVLYCTVKKKKYGLKHINYS